MMPYKLWIPLNLTGLLIISLTNKLFSTYFTRIIRISVNVTVSYTVHLVSAARVFLRDLHNLYELA